MQRSSSKRLKMDTPPLNFPLDGQTLDEFEVDYSSHVSSCTKDYSIGTVPFKTVTFKSILPVETAQLLLKEVKDLDYKSRENDLYSLQQSKDLNSEDSTIISSIKDFIYTNVREVIEKLCHTKFNDQVDLHAIHFDKTQHLLCHSDSLSTRHTAFILYLVDKDWKSDWGGNLELFACDENLKPVSAASSLTPEFNSFTWFNVSNVSWHQVTEVLEDRSRWSISGWFHSDNPPLLPEVLPISFPTPKEPNESSIDILADWINPKYLEAAVNTKINLQFCEMSEVSLREFLLPEKYTSLINALKSAKWELRGPYDKRKYFTYNSSHNKLVEDFMNLLQSDSIAILLSHLTGMVFSRNYKETDNSLLLDNPFGYANMAVEKWTPGCYSLITDNEVECLPDRVTIYLHLDVASNTDISHGGHVTYICRESSDDPLLIIPPCSNSLDLVFSKHDEYSFRKYINSTMKQPFYCFTAQFIPREEVEQEGVEGAENEDGDDDSCGSTYTVTDDETS